MEGEVNNFITVKRKEVGLMYNIKLIIVNFKKFTLQLTNMTLKK